MHSPGGCASRAVLQKVKLTSGVDLKPRCCIQRKRNKIQMLIAFVIAVACVTGTILHLAWDLYSSNLWYFALVAAALGSLWLFKRLATENERLACCLLSVRQANRYSPVTRNPLLFFLDFQGAESQRLFSPVCNSMFTKQK